MHARDYSTNTAAYDRAKVLVLGDAGVGKSTLVHMLCHGEALRGAASTVGCNIDVRLHAAPSSTLRATTAGSAHLANGSVPASTSLSSATPTFIEFYDISGSPSVQHPRSRHMFYAGTYHGIILVHDLCNRRSFDNLWRWMGDFIEVNSSNNGSYSRPINPDHGSSPFRRQDDFELSPRGMPILVVGNKKDLAPEAIPDKRSLHGGEAISVCSVTSSEFMPNTTTSIALNAFFTRVIDNRHQRPTSSPSAYSTTSSPYTATVPPPLTPSVTTASNSLHSPTAFSPNHIPIMDFATFTAGSSSSTSSNTAPQETSSPSMNGSVRSQSPAPRPTTPTMSGVRSVATSRPTYDRHRIGLGSSHAAAMGVPIYTHSRAINTSRGSKS